MQKKIQRAAWVLIVVLGLYILYRGLAIVKESRFLQKIPGISGVGRTLEAMAVKTHMPALTFAWQGTDYPKAWTDLVLDEIFPLYSFAKEEAEKIPDIESRLEYELMMELESQTEALADASESGTAQEGKQPETVRGAQKEGGGTESTAEIRKGTEAPSESTAEGQKGEEAPSESMAEGQKGEETPPEGMAEGQKGQGAESPPEITAKDPKREPAVTFDENELRDYDYLLNNFFAVDPSTTPLESQINYDTLMAKDLKLSTDASLPQILIYHTHSQEAFADSVEGDVNDTIVGVGNRLTEILTDTYGYNVIHHTEVYDLIDGVLDRNKAYTLAAPDIQQILDENPSIEVVIDLHRDGVDGYKFVTDIDGKPTAQIMFFNGLSRSAKNGEIDYLPNPYIEDNLAFSFQLQLKADEYYPGWTRNIYLQSLRYNLHMRPRSLLIESGTQLNTVQEELNSMELLADILNQVLRGE